MSSSNEKKAKRKHLTKLERLQQRQEKISSDIRKEKNKLNAQKRKDDTRRKIIMGALVFAHMEKDQDFKEICERLQQKGISSDLDRKLFGLSPIPKATNN